MQIVGFPKRRLKLHDKSVSVINLNDFMKSKKRTDFALTAACMLIKMNTEYELHIAKLLQSIQFVLPIKCLCSTFGLSTKSP